MISMTEIEKLKRLTGERDEVLLQILLDDAEQFRPVLHRPHTDRDRLGEGRPRSGSHRPEPDGDRGRERPQRGRGVIQF